MRGGATGSDVTPPRVFFFCDVIFPTVFPYYSSSTIVLNVSLRMTNRATGSDPEGVEGCVHAQPGFPPFFRVFSDMLCSTPRHCVVFLRVHLITQ